MVKIEVRVSHRTDIYKTSGEKGKGWSFISKEKNGKWPGEYSNEDAEWYVIIEENLPCIKGLTDELEQEFSDRVNKEINEIEKGKKYVPITYELEFDENAGKTNTPDREGWTKKRIFWDDGNIKIKKVSKDNDREREREREQNWGTEETNWGIRSHC